MTDKERQAEQAEERDLSAVQERLSWKLAARDDEKVAKGLYAGEEIEEMHQLSEAGLLDDFFVYLKEIGILSVFEQVMFSGFSRDWRRVRVCWRGMPVEIALTAWEHAIEIVWPGRNQPH